MADETKQAAPQTSVSPTPPASEPAKFEIPAKFKDKGLEDVIKSYTELEKQFSSASTKAKAADDWGAIKHPDGRAATPAEVQEVIAWARNMHSALESGQLKSAAAERAPTKADAPPGIPWEAENWDLLSPRDQAKALNEHYSKNLNTTIDQRAQFYGKQIDDFMKSFGKQQQLLITAINAALRNPGKVDLTNLLSKAAEFASENPDTLLERALSTIVNPVDNQAEIERQVAARVAEELQKKENARLDLITPRISPKPRLAPTAKNRQDEERSVIEQLRKQGIDLLS